MLANIVEQAPAGIRGAFASATDDEGRFTLEHVPTSVTALTAVAVDGSSGLTLLPAGSGPLDIGDIVLSPPGGRAPERAERQKTGSLVAKVVDDTGTPIARFSVTAAGVDEACWGAGEFESSREKEVLLEGLQPGGYTVTIEAPGRAAVVRPAVRVSAGAATDLGRIVLLPGGTVRGSVVDRDGSAVSGAAVAIARPTDGAQLGHEVTTTESGEFVLSGLRAGSFDIVVTHPDYVAPAPTEVEIDPFGEAAEVELVLSEGGRIEGAVTSRSGAPLAGARVSAAVAGARRGFTANGEVQADGSFVIKRVPPGSVVVTLLKRVGPMTHVPAQSRQVQLTDGASVFIEFRSREVLVSGLVTGRGMPRAGYGVALITSGTSPIHTAGDPMASPPAVPEVRPGVATTGADGSYSLMSLEPGVVSIVVTSPNGRTRYPSRELVLPDTDAFVFDIELGGVPVAGRVEDGETGTALPGAEVSLRSTEGITAPIVSRAGPDGRFSLEAEPGSYRLLVAAEGYSTAAGPQVVPEWGLDEVRVALSRGRAITGTVKGPGGQLMAGVAVNVLSLSTGHLASTRTDPSGRFHINRLGEGRHTLVAGSSRVGYVVLDVPLVVDAPLAMQLRPGGVARITLRADDGSSVPGAYPQVVRVDGRPVAVPVHGQGPTDEHGMVDLPSPAGLVEIELRTATRVAHATVRIGEGAVSPVEMIH
jgi:hypothetical protein